MTKKHVKVQETEDSEIPNIQHNELMMNPDEYSLFIDSSEVIIDYYKNQDSYGLEKYFVDIEEWLQEDLTASENIPLLIEAEEGVGKKTLLVKWLEHHKETYSTDYRDTVITHFASAGGNNCNYFYAIYGLLIKLRQSFNINQKVELLEEKLRKYFFYWLDICARKIKDTVVYDGKIIIVIEGIENFIEPETRKESSLKFWLPSSFPQGVRVIVTAEPDSRSAEYLRNLGCKSIKVTANEEVVQNYIERMKKKTFYVPDSHKNKLIEIAKDKAKNNESKMIFYKAMFASLAPSTMDEHGEVDKEIKFYEGIYKHLDYDKLRSLSTTDELLNYILTFYSDRLLPLAEYTKVLGLLCFTQKGLTIQELLSLTSISKSALMRMLSLFKVFVMSFHGYWVCNHEGLRTKVIELYKDPEPEEEADKDKEQKTGDDAKDEDNNYKKESDEEKKKKDKKKGKGKKDKVEKKERNDISQVRQILHKEIATQLNETPNSIRRLEEQTHHLYYANDTFQLKQTISLIENFLLLFNPMNKFDLFRYWQNLENLGYDPVIEYNKGIELFDTHYSPAPDKLFKIILQVCRFLKEFSDFETEITPDFRHPLIRGKKGVKTSKIKKNEENYMKEKREVKERQMKKNESKEKEDGRYQELNPFYNENPFYLDEDGDANPEEEHPATEIPTPGDTETYEYLEEIGLFTELSKFGLIHKHNKDRDEGKPPSPQERILQEWESVNVEVPAGRDSFRKHFLEMIREKYQYSENRTLANADNDPFCYFIGDDENGKKNSNKYQIGYSEADKEHEEQEDPITAQYKGMINNDDLIIKSEKNPSFYYYKRWIWIIFPWACMSIDPDLQFSDVIGKCYSSATQYMRIEEEKAFYSDALNIAIKYKKKKKLMYAKTEEIEQYKKLQEERMLLKLKSQTKNTKSMKSLSRASTVKSFQSTQKLPKIKSSAKLALSSNNNTALKSGIKESVYLTRPKNKSDLSLIEEDTEINQDPNAIQSQAFNESILNTINPMKKKSNARIQNILGGLNMKNHDSLKKLDATLQDNAALEIKGLKDENSKLANELNEISYKITSLQKKIAKIPKEQLNSNGLTVEEQMQQDLSSLNARNIELEKKLHVVERRKQRMRNILEILDINSSQNEKWIRDLNRLIANYEKMIRYERIDLRRERKEISDLTQLKADYILEFNTNASKQLDFVKHVQKSLGYQKELTMMIRNTDSMIQMNLISQQKESEHQAKLDEAKQEQTLKKNTMERRRKYLEEQLEKYRKLREQFSDIFDAVDEEVNFEEGEKFQSMLENLDTKKNLDRNIFELTQNINALKENQEEISEQIETLKKAKSQESGQRKEDSYDKALGFLQKNSHPELKTKLRSAEQGVARVQDTYKKKVNCISTMKTGLKNIKALNGIPGEDDFERHHRIMIIENITNKLIDIRHFLSEEQYGKLVEGKLDVSSLLTDFMQEIEDLSPNPMDDRLHTDESYN